MQFFQTIKTVTFERIYLIIFSFKLQYIIKLTKYRDGREQMVLAPEGVKPSATLVENAVKKEEGKFKSYRRKVAMMRGTVWLAEKMSFSPIASLLLSALFPFSLARLWLMGFNVPFENKIKTFTQKMILGDPPRTDFNAPFNTDEAAEILVTLFLFVFFFFKFWD